MDAPMFLLRFAPLCMFFNKQPVGSCSSPRYMARPPVMQAEESKVGNTNSYSHQPHLGTVIGSTFLDNAANLFFSRPQRSSILVPGRRSVGCGEYEPGIKVHLHNLTVEFTHNSSILVLILASSS
eukprot:527030-Ditylum_brightwellii.AAC.1